MGVKLGANLDVEVSAVVNFPYFTEVCVGSYSEFMNQNALKSDAKPDDNCMFCCSAPSYPDTLDNKRYYNMESMRS